MSTSVAYKPVGPALAVTVTVEDGRLRVLLADGREISIPLEWFPRLNSATPAQLANWRLIGRGLGIHWEDLDEDLSVEGLLDA